MSSNDFIIALFYRVDQIMREVPKYPQFMLYPSEVVPLVLLFVLK